MPAHKDGQDKPHKNQGSKSSDRQNQGRGNAGGKDGRNTKDSGNGKGNK